MTSYDTSTSTARRDGRVRSVRRVTAGIAAAAVLATAVFGGLAARSTLGEESASSAATTDAPAGTTIDTSSDVASTGYDTADSGVARDDDSSTISSASASDSAQSTTTQSSVTTTSQAPVAASGGS